MPLDALQSSIVFNVNWAGTDTGSGIQKYNVFVSENGGPFALWLSGTTSTSSAFIGQPGKSYSFYSVSRDGAGNLEPDKTAAESFTGTPSTILNSIDDPRFFVRQQYLDFLARSPDDDGWGYWTNEITRCGTGAQCLHDRRVGVSDAFFFEPEFQQTGAYIYRIYKTGLGQNPSFAQFTADRGLVVSGSQLDSSKTAYALSFVQRDDFLQLYPRT
jgi:hypothetical protein